MRWPSARFRDVLMVGSKACSTRPCRFMGPLMMVGHMLKRAIPVIHVADAVAAEEFYCRRLGFNLVSAWRADATLANPAYLTIERDGVQLHLTSFKDGTVGIWTSNVYIFVDDVDGLFAELSV